MKTPKKLSRYVALGSLIALIPAYGAHADDGKSGYLGVLGGVNFPSNNSANTTPTFGATIGGKLAPPVGIALFGSYYGQTSSGTLFGLPTGSTTSTYIVTGQLNLFAGGLHIGGEIGPEFTSWSGNISTLSSGTSNTSWVYGPEAGYDIIFGAVSIGAEAHYLFNNSDGGVNNIDVLAALKVWF